MKKTLLALLTALLISSCGANRGNSFKDSEITVVVLEVANDLEKRGVNTSRIYREVDSWMFDESRHNGINGYCNSHGKDVAFNLKQVDVGAHAYVNREYWNRLTNLEKRALIAHEVVGHCAFDKRHTKTGIMQPVAVMIVNSNGYENLMDNFALTLK